MSTQAELCRNNSAAFVFMVSLTIDVDRTKGANLKSRVELELKCLEKDR